MLCSHSRGVLLWNPANIKVENNGAVGYVGSSPIMHNPLFWVHKFGLDKLMRWILVFSKFKMIGMQLNDVHGQV